MRNAAHISSTYIYELCYNICKIIYKTYSNGKGLKIRYNDNYLRLSRKINILN